MSSKVATNQKVGGSNPSGATIVNPVAMQSTNCIAIFILSHLFVWIVYRIIVQNIIKISSILKKSELGFSFWKKSLN